MNCLRAARRTLSCLACALVTLALLADRACANDVPPRPPPPNWPVAETQPVPTVPAPPVMGPTAPTPNRPPPPSWPTAPAPTAPVAPIPVQPAPPSMGATPPPPLPPTTDLMVDYGYGPVRVAPGPSTVGAPGPLPTAPGTYTQPIQPATGLGLGTPAASFTPSSGPVSPNPGRQLPGVPGGRTLRSVKRPSFRLGLEGVYTPLSDPDGRVGEPTADALVFDGLDYEAAFGFRGTLEFALDRERVVQARATWYGTFDDTDTGVGTVGSQVTPGAPVTASASTAALLERTRDLVGIELNMFWRLGRGSRSTIVEALGGLRVLALDDESRVRNLNPVLTPALTPASGLRAEVTNTFYGVQGGLRVTTAIAATVELQGSVRLGLGLLDRDVDVEDSAMFTSGVASDDDSDVVFGVAVDANLGLRVQMSENIAVLIGAHALYMPSVANADEPFDFRNTSSGRVGARLRDSDFFVASIVFGLGFDF